jgi:hypothetical protein
MEKRLTVWWDKEGDLLELTIGKARKGFFMPINGDVLVRLDSKTKEPIGIIFINFSKNFKNKSRKISLPIELKLKMLK